MIHTQGFVKVCQTHTHTHTQVTHLRSARSVLLPTSMMTTSAPRSLLTSSIHLEELRKEVRPGNIRQQDRSESAKQPGEGGKRDTPARRTGDVIGNNGDRGVADVAGDQTPEAPEQQQTNTLFGNLPPEKKTRTPGRRCPTAAAALCGPPGTLFWTGSRCRWWPARRMTEST